MTTPSGPGHGQPDPDLSAIMSERRQLINLTYRLLGSLAEAEDAVQETYVRWYALSQQQQDAIESPAAWLTTVASRICLSLLGSTRVRRETYVGEWIPEPLPERTESITGRPGGPTDRVTLNESVSMAAFLVVLESMTPAERVAFILHDVFGYSFAEVAGIVGRTPAACRQLASSARHRIPAAQPPVPPAARQAGIVRAFKQAWEAKDIDDLIGLLDPDASAIADGGGLASTFFRPIEGGEQIARAWVEIASRAPTLTFLEHTVNGQPGLVAQQDGVTVTVFAFDVAGDRIKRIWATSNPEKLRPWTTDDDPCLADLPLVVLIDPATRHPRGLLTSVAASRLLSTNVCLAGSRCGSPDAPCPSTSPSRASAGGPQTRPWVSWRSGRRVRLSGWGRCSWRIRPARSSRLMLCSALQSSSVSASSCAKRASIGNWNIAS